MIRRGRGADSRAMGRIYCLAWQKAYQGMVPQEFLDGLTEENCAPDPVKVDQGNSFVDERDGEVAGLVNYGALRENAEENLGEIRSIYVLPGHWRAGVGTALFRAACDALRQMGYAGAVVWTLKQNARARAFYVRMGMRADGMERAISIGSAEVKEVRYEIRF